MQAEPRITAVVSVLAVALTLAAVWGSCLAAAEQEADLSGRWEGEIAFSEAGVEVVLDLRARKGGWRGELDIPGQNARHLLVPDVLLEGSAVTFGLPAVPGGATFVGTLSDDGQRIAGEFSQPGRAAPLVLRRTNDPLAGGRDALEGFEQFVERAVDQWQGPGLGVGIVANGEVLWAKGFGLREVESELPVTPQTLFAIGSCTKAFTTFAIATLVEEGKLDWDEPVQTYLPGFRLMDGYASDHVTLRDMACHRTGMPRHDMVFYNNLTISRAELVQRMRYLEPNADLRERVQYNSLMYAVAGYVAGQAMGATWEEEVRSRVFEPLGMARTTTSIAQMQASDDFAMPYAEKDGELRRVAFRSVELTGPAGSINSCVDDMCAWMLAMLGNGEYQGRRVLGEALCRELYTPQVPAGGLRSEGHLSPLSFALGWMVDTYHGHLRAEHGGAIDGFTAKLTLFPNDGIGIITMANKQGPLVDIVALHAADRLLGTAPRGQWAFDAMSYNEEALARHARNRAEGDTAAERKRQDRIEGTELDHPLADYAGNYENPGYGPIRVELGGDRLVMVYNEIATPLEHWHYEVFRGLESPDDPLDLIKDLKVTFHTSTDGHVGSLSVPFESRVDDIVFQRRADSRLADPEYLRRYVGRYKEPDGPVVSVVLEGEQLVLLLPGDQRFRLKPTPAGRFALVGVEDLSISFHTTEEGNVEGLSIHAPGAIHELGRIEELPAEAPTG